MIAGMFRRRVAIVLPAAPRAVPLPASVATAKKASTNTTT
jgi:hypothetical protein